MLQQDFEQIAAEAWMRGRSPLKRMYDHGEHQPIWAGRSVVRQISTVPASRVGRLEETSRPLE